MTAFIIFMAIYFAAAVGTSVGIYRHLAKRKVGLHTPVITLAMGLLWPYSLCVMVTYTVWGRFYEGTLFD